MLMNLTESNTKLHWFILQILIQSRRPMIIVLWSKCQKKKKMSKVHLVKAMVFPVVMYGCENWNIKKAECQRIDAFELFKKTLESPLDSKKIKPVNPKRNQSWIFIRRTDAEAPILWPPDAKNWLMRKDPDAGKDWRQEEKGTTEDKMVGWHHWPHGQEFE